MHSHHSHSGSFCAHAQGTLEAVVLEAIRQGFTVYCLSEHVPRYRVRDLYPEEASLGLSHLFTAFEAYVQEAHRLKDLHANQIQLLVGLETEYVSALDLKGLGDLLERHGGQIDYLVGSVHHVAGWPIDLDEATWQKAVVSSDSDNPLEEPPTPTLSPALLTTYFSTYFDAQLDLFRRFHPEVVGHFDLCRLYVPSLRFDDPIYAGVWEKIVRNVEYAVRYGACFEVNAAAFRKGWKTAYPGGEVLNLILSKGGRLVLSDDSHGPHAVGHNYHLLFDYLTYAGVTELWYLERCVERNVGGRSVRAAKVAGDWRRDRWWSLRLREIPQAE